MTHADVDLKEPPRRRLGAVVLIQDEQNRVLLVRPTYRDGHQLPGGAVYQFETIAEGAARELEEETGLVRRLTHFVALDYMPYNPETGVAEGLNVVCVGGVLGDAAADAVAVPDTAAEELESCLWAWPDQLYKYCVPYQERRIREALDAIENGNELPLLVVGERVGA